MGIANVLDSRLMLVNVPKTRRTYCKGKNCRKHTVHKVTQYKTGKASVFAQVTTLFLPKSPNILTSGKTTIRQKTKWLWWSNKTCLPQKGTSPSSSFAFVGEILIYCRRKRQRRLCCVWNVMSANIELNCR